MKALIRIQAKYRPVSGDIQGFRIQACIPNNEARKMVKTSSGFRATEETVPAFRKPFLITESMDYSEVSHITESELERFKKKLLWEGFTEYEMIAKKDDKPAKQIDAATKAAIDKAMGWEADAAPF